MVPRYGEEIVGGAETLVRAFATHLPAKRFDTEILTTCARNHHSWENELPPGVTETEGGLLRRFPVASRDVGSFLSVQERLSAGLRLDLEEELLWARESVNSPELYRYLADEANGYDAIFFAPYLFGTTLLGSQVAPERSVLIPCLHDEPFAYTRVVAQVFRSVRGAFFNAAPERALAARLYGVGAEAPVVGLGFDPPPPLDAGPSFRERYGLDGEYVLYFGRKEGGKNLPFLLEAFARCRDAGRGLSLVIAGDGVLDPSTTPHGVVDLPRLSEQDKRLACAGALAVCQPSTNESFSIVVMEAWLEGTPVLVHAACPVTREHVRASGGGLYFADAGELAAEVEYLRDHPDEARALGRAGEAYVRSEYSWERVLERFETGLARVLGEAS